MPVAARAYAHVCIVLCEQSEAFKLAQPAQVRVAQPPDDLVHEPRPVRERDQHVVGVHPKYEIVPGSKPETRAPLDFDGKDAIENTRVELEKIPRPAPIHFDDGILDFFNIVL